MLVSFLILLHQKIFVFSVRVQQVVMQSFSSWNGRQYHRYLNQMQLLTDKPDDYHPSKQTRFIVKRNISINNIAMNYKKK